MKDELFDEAAELLSDLERKIDESIRRHDAAETENPFGRRSNEVDRTIRRLEEILDEIKSARDSALEYLEK